MRDKLWRMAYLLQTLPPNLFRFYFFDGEKISDFVFNSSKNSDFKDAFLKLCSLDTMEIIRENFRRISRSKAKGIMTLSAEYDTDSLLGFRYCVPALVGRGATQAENFCRLGSYA